MDEVFGVPPAGENNDPEPYEAPLYEEEPFPDFEAEIEREMDEEEHDDTQPPAGRSLAKGVRFEQIDRRAVPQRNRRYTANRSLKPFQL